MIEKLNCSIFHNCTLMRVLKKEFTSAFLQVVINCFIQDCLVIKPWKSLYSTRIQCHGLSLFLFTLYRNTKSSSIEDACIISMGVAKWAVDQSGHGTYWPFGKFENRFRQTGKTVGHFKNRF